MPNSCLPEVVYLVTKNLIGFYEIDGIEYLFLLTIIDNTLSFTTFPFSNTKFLDLEGFTDIHSHDRALSVARGRHKEKPVKIPLKCLCQLDGAVVENNLL